MDARDIAKLLGGKMAVRSEETSDFLIEPTWLAVHTEDPKIRIIDCRSRDDYEHGHIPEAIPIGVDYWLKQSDQDGPRGLYMRSIEDLTDLIQNLGINSDHSVIGYDDNQGRGAARLWWTLKYLGHKNARVLNGGWSAWSESQFPISRHNPNKVVGDFQAMPESGRLATRDQVLTP